MKKLFLTIAVITFMAINCRSQDNGTDFRETPQFGIKIGANYSNVYATKGESFNSDPKFGFVTGIFAAIPIGKYMGVQPEVLFSQKGFKAKGSILGGSYDLKRTTNYIDVPILFQLKPSGYFTLLVGPQFSYLLKQKDEFANATSSIDQEQEFKNDNIRRNTMCFIIGGDINLNHLVLGGRIGWDLFNNNGDGTSTTPRYKNIWYQFTLGYRFYY